MAQATSETRRSATHPNHTHTHGAGCGHTAVRHEGHIDYLHDGHMHHMSEGGVEEHAISVSAPNTAECTPGHDCHGHAKEHQHGASCGHAAVPHGDHVDYLVEGHLHRPHGGHCDHHGELMLA